MLYGQFRWGRVSSVDKDRHTAQVQFFEIDGMVSFDLQVLVPFGGDYCLPKKDQPVFCALMDGTDGQGYVLGTFYTDDDTAPLSDAGQRAIAGDDLRLGDPEADDKVALSSIVDDLFTTLRAAITAAKSAVVAQDGGLAAFTALDAALKPPALTYSWPKSVAAEKVSAK